MNPFGSCSNGSLMLTPKLRSRPAPSWQARMMPCPPPVMTMKSRAAISRENSSAVRYAGSIGGSARGPEAGDLPHAPIRREHLEGVAQLAQRGVQDLQIADARAIAQQA